MAIQSLFQLLIPFSYDDKKLQLSALEQYFSVRQISKSAQLEGSPLLDGNSLAYVECMEMSQSARRKVGIHQNENYMYLLERENISFRVGKVKLWQFRGGIMFLAIEIRADKLEKEDILNLLSELANIKTQKKISYEQKTGKDTSEKRIFTIKEMMKAIFELQGEGVFSEIEGKTFQRAYCLYYGFGSLESDVEISGFLEMLRNQYKSNRSTGSGLLEENCFAPFSYITWAVSEHTLAAFSDIGKGGVENEQFLTDSGGLSQSVFANYLPVYLNCLAVCLRWNILCKKYNIYDSTAVRTISEEGVCELYELLNTPIYGLTNETHINTLFDRYLCVNVLGLPEKLKMLSEGENIQYMNRIYAEVAAVKDQMKALVEFWQDGMGQIRQERGKLEWTEDEKKDDRTVSDFISSSSDYINDEVKNMDVLVEQEVEYLGRVFGKTWNRLCQVSKSSLISAGVLWRSCGRIERDDFDFSGVCISATSALEMELGRIFFFGFQDYWERKCGRPDRKLWERTFEQWPERLLSSSRKEFEKRQREGKFCKLEKNGIFTMGVLPYLFGKYDNRAERGQDVFMQQCMEEYLKSILKEEYTENAIRIFYREEDPGCFVLRCEKVRNDYRNPAAHSNIMSKDMAESCYKAVVGKREAAEHLSDVNGLLLQMYSFLK